MAEAEAENPRTAESGQRRLLDASYLTTIAVFATPAAERPTHDTIDGIAEWLVGPALRISPSAAGFDQFCWRLRAAGLPVRRVQVNSGTLHPQFLGVAFAWDRAEGRSEQALVAHEVMDAGDTAGTLLRRAFVSGETLRLRLEGPEAGLLGDSAEMRVLRAVGATDYFVLPIEGIFARRYVASFATDRPGGFSESDIAALHRLGQRLVVGLDLQNQHWIGRNLLDAYLGPKTGPKVLAGLVRRGQGEEIAAILWSSDLRGFTALSDRLPGARVIAILNALFDVQAQAIHRHGGEILKFIGDGLLAIFPIDESVTAAVASRHAAAAAREALEAVAGLAADPLLAGEPPLKIVIALHAGTAMHGNVGAADRLDFTVIGPAVNLVSRIEAVAKSLDQPVVMSEAFARVHDGRLISLGRHTLRGLANPIELFAPAVNGDRPAESGGTAILTRRETD